jgi:hypothetical protein
MHQSHVIDIAGVFAGAAIRLPHAYRFVAVASGLSALDGQEFGDLAEIRRAVRQRMAATPDTASAAPPRLADAGVRG